MAIFIGALSSAPSIDQWRRLDTALFAIICGPTGIVFTIVVTICKLGGAIADWMDSRAE